MIKGRVTKRRGKKHQVFLFESLCKKEENTIVGIVNQTTSGLKKMMRWIEFFASILTTYSPLQIPLENI